MPKIKEGSIRFFYEGVDFKMRHIRKTSQWVKDVLRREKRNFETLNFIFCSDEHLLSINQEYLNHNTFTDIITFNFSEGAVISGDIYISPTRAFENATKFNEPFDRELHRVIIHGVLHLLGFNDKSKREKALMRKKEEACLSLRK